MMKKLIYLSFLLPLVGNAQTTVIKPSTKQATAFAIVTDNQTYANTKEAMHLYKDAVEADGLATYLISGDFQNPDQVKEEIIKVYKECPSLEGIVLVGDIPVALVRNAQHMTTAFKMREKAFPWDQSSVPTDRFYDDLNLKFQYLKQDSVNPQHHYYKLTEDSPQRLNPTFYSARIKYPEKKGGDKYQAIASFLKKAAAAKAEKNNQLNEVFSFNGDSYNSDCMIVWMDDEKAYKENFPLAFGRKMGFKHWNFRMKHPMKYNLFDELQRKDLDVFMFHEHGMPTGQLINGELACGGLEDRYQMLKSTLYNAVVGHTKEGESTDKRRLQMQEKRNVTEVFFKDLDNKEWWAADSTHYADERINTIDLMSRNLKTNPKFIMFDACYNGSFHEEDYIAGQYIFNDGLTLVAQGNTRNVLQDRWTIEMIGLMSHGVRAGQYNRIIASLEGHLLGDPTLRFAPIEENTWSVDMTLRKNDKSYWEGLLDSKYADIQSLAMRMIADLDTKKEFSSKLLEIYRTTPFNTTRMEAVKLLSRYKDGSFTEVLKESVNDAYELCARLSANYAAFNGDESLIPYVVEGMIEHNERFRVQMGIQKALSLFPKEKVLKAVDDFYAKVDRVNEDDEKARVLRGLNRDYKNDEKKHAVVMDQNADWNDRVMAIRTVRNYTAHVNVDDYLKLIRDDANPLEVRVVMTEALGWFTQSVKSPYIVSELKKYYNDSLPEDLKLEIEQTINRLTL